MTKTKKVVAGFVALMFLMGSLGGCGVSDKKLQTAASYAGKVVVYLTWAQTLVDVAAKNYTSNEKVMKAMEATQKAIDAVKVALQLVEAGLDKDEKNLAVKTAELLTAAFELARAIKDAK